MRFDERVCLQKSIACNNKVYIIYLIIIYHTSTSTCILLFLIFMPFEVEQRNTFFMVDRFSFKSWK